jgi:DNA invertase Pin-like site-specific DNA recombinase
MNSNQTIPADLAIDKCFNGAGTNFSHPKISTRHLQKIAYVYVRQSSLQQVNNNRESTQTQYQLADRAHSLGWAKDRIIVIDEDLGKSGQHAENRSGFQKLLSELALDHVGLILVVEMSRLARSCKDWYQLLEVCGIFDALLADSDGIYDVTNYNDRLLLGLRGTMSEAELHVMRGRLWSGKLNKARRGDLRNGQPPTGYILNPGGAIVLDPDEQVRFVIALTFKKYREIGTIHGVLLYMVKNQIQFGFRKPFGDEKGDLEWRPPNQTLITRIIHSPWYAGAYAFGRLRTDHKQQVQGKPRSGIRRVAMEDWFVLIKDSFPSYITWSDFEINQDHLEANASKCKSTGAPRNGAALLVGLLKCVKCGYRMTASYKRASGSFQYMCVTDYARRGTAVCQYFTGKEIDALVSMEILHAIEPASLELAISTIKSIELERHDVEKNWQQKIERARYAAKRAERQYKAVDPENRLVANSLEDDWEKSLLDLKAIQEDYERCCSACPTKLTQQDIETIKNLSADIPKIWQSQSTEHRDRKEIARQLIESIYAESKDGDDMLNIEIIWKGGQSTHYRLSHAVGRYDKKHDFDLLKSRVISLRADELTTSQIADRLNMEGFRPAVAEKFVASTVTQMVQHFDLQRRTCCFQKRVPVLGANEWLPTTLAIKLGVSLPTIGRWLRQGVLKARRDEDGQRRWIAWADEGEIERLKQLYVPRIRHTRRQDHERQAERTGLNIRG